MEKNINRRTFLKATTAAAAGTCAARTLPAWVSAESGSTAKEVIITVVKGNVEVNREPVYVSIPDGDEVNWINAQGYDFDIVFEDTPFQGDVHVFQGRGGKPARSGRARPGTGGGRKYKYMVVITSDPRVRPLDPTVRPWP